MAVEMTQRVENDMESGKPGTGKRTAPWTQNVTFLQRALVFMCVLSIALMIGLGVCGETIVKEQASPESSAAPLSRGASRAQVDATLGQFNAGEEKTDALGAISIGPLLDKSSSDRIQRYEGTAAEDPNHDKYHLGRTDVYNHAGTKTHETYFEILEAGQATIGEYTDRHGRVGQRTMRLQVKHISSGDRFFLVPLGLSMAFNQTTLRPDLFYFSYHKAGTALSARVATFCSVASSKNFGTCYLGHGQKQWDEVVLEWSTRYLKAVGYLVDDDVEAANNGRRLMQANENTGGKVGGVIGDAVGDTVGEDVGDTVGSWAGGAIGGAVAGPVGAAVGAEIGGWLGGKVGGEIGGDVGEDVGSTIGSDVENAATGDSGSSNWGGSSGGSAYTGGGGYYGTSGDGGYYGGY
jgi:hypothetical protein